MKEDGKINKYLQMIFALPYLPTEHIKEGFQSILRRVEKHVDGGELEEFLGYVENTWLNNSVWGLESLSVFKMTNRTNNDLEGWHNRLNSKLPQTNPNMYTLIAILAKEAELTKVNAQLVANEQYSKRILRNQSVEFLWSIYNTYSKPSQFLADVIGYVPRTFDD